MIFFFSETVEHDIMNEEPMRFLEKIIKIQIINKLFIKIQIIIIYSNNL